MLKMLIAVDGSVHASRAIEAVARLARDTHELQVLLMNVRDSPVLPGDLPAVDIEALGRFQREQQDALLAAALIHARRSGLTQVQTLASGGSVAPEIVRIAVEHAADQIVVGTRGMNALGGMLLGSVAQRVVHLAAVPVLLVK